MIQPDSTQTVSDLPAVLTSPDGSPVLISRTLGSRKSSHTTVPGDVSSVVISPDGSPVLVSRHLGSRPDFSALAIQPDGSPGLQSRSSLGSRGQGISNAQRDFVVQQISSLREGFAQDLQKSLKLMQRLESDVAVMSSTLQGLQHDIDRQQGQITDLVQSRLTASGVQQRVAREKDLEISHFMDNVMKELDALRIQQRKESSTAISKKGDQNYRIDQRLVELQKELEQLNSEVVQVRATQETMESSFSEIQKEKGSSIRQSIREELSEQSAQEERQSIMGELKTHKEHIVSYKEDQQKLEMMILEMRKELQGAHTDAARSQADFCVQKDELSQQLMSYKSELSEHKDQLSSHKDDLKQQKENLSSHTDEFQKHKAELAIHKEDLSLQKNDFQRRAVGFSDLQDSFAQACTDAIQAAIQHMQRSQQDWHQAQQMVTDEQQQKIDELESFVKEALSAKENLEKTQAKHNEMTLVVANNKTIVHDLSQAVNAETTARIELSQALDTYRYSHLQTCAELRAELSTQTERLTLLESTSSSSEANEGLIELRVDEMKKLVHAEANSRMELSKFMEAYHAANLKTCTEFRKDLNSALEQIGRVERSHDESREAHSRLHTDHQEHRRTVETQLQSHLKTHEDLRVKVESAHTRFEEYRTCGDAEKDVQSLVKLIGSESTARLQLERQLESSMAVALESRSKLRADLDKVFKWLALLEDMAQDQRTAHESALQGVNREVKRVHDGARNEVEETQLEARQIRGSLDTLGSSLQSVASDLQVERHTRSREASDLQSGLNQLREKLQLSAESQSQHESSMKQLEGNLRELEKLIIQSTSGENGQAIRENVSDLLVRAKETQRLHDGIQLICDKLDALETTAAKDRGWRKQAVQDVEHILDDLSHLSPNVPPRHMSYAPTLASAMRLSKRTAEAGADL